MNKDMIHEPRYFDNVRALLEWGAETYGDDTVYSFRPTPRAEVEKKTFVEFRNDVRALASELLSMGCAGRHCVVIGKLSYDWATLYYATLSIGGVLIPLDRDWQAEDLAATVERAEADFLFCDADLKEKAAVIEEKVRLATSTVYLGGKEDDLSIASLIEKGRAKFEADPDAYFNAPIDPHTMSLLVFTSGTTGKGKGVMLSQNAILSDLSSVIPYMDFGKKTVGASATDALERWLAGDWCRYGYEWYRRTC